jgi:putative N6-adenine-specific DNA methylase
MDWDHWLSPDCDLEVFAACKRSRLKIKSRIEETCLEAWQAWQRASGHKPNLKKKAKLFIRIIEDEATLSLDTSGERLHKRGIRQHVGEAPLRETIAAALLQMAGHTYEVPPEEVELIDPMMGSGTFFIEALSRDELIDVREFGFESFIHAEPSRPTLNEARPKFIGGVGFEQDSKAFKACQSNLKRAKESKAWDLRNKDFFSESTTVASAAAAGETSSPQRWVFANPPYGERLAVEGSLAGFYQKLFQACENFAKPDRACFLLPAKSVKGKFILPVGWKVLEKRPFLNGGIPVVAFVFGR